MRTAIFSGYVIRAERKYSEEESERCLFSIKLNRCKFLLLSRIVIVIFDLASNPLKYDIEIDNN